MIMKFWRKLHFWDIQQSKKIQDNNVQMKADLEKFLYHLRIDAKVDVIEMVS